MKDEKTEHEKPKQPEHPKHPEKPKTGNKPGPHPDTVPAPVGDDGPGNG